MFNWSNRTPRLVTLRDRYSENRGIMTPLTALYLGNRARDEDGIPIILENGIIKIVQRERADDIREIDDLPSMIGRAADRRPTFPLIGIVARGPSEWVCRVRGYWYGNGWRPESNHLVEMSTGRLPYPLCKGYGARGALPAGEVWARAMRKRYPGPDYLVVPVVSHQRTTESIHQALTRCGFGVE